MTRVLNWTTWNCLYLTSYVRKHRTSEGQWALLLLSLSIFRTDKSHPQFREANQHPGYSRVKTRPHYIAPSQRTTPTILEKSTRRISSLDHFARTRSVSKDAFSDTSNLWEHLQASNKREKGAWLLTYLNYSQKDIWSQSWKMHVNCTLCSVLLLSQFKGMWLLIMYF